MNTKPLLIAAGLVILAVLGIAGYFLFQSGSSTTLPPTGTGSPPFGTPGGNATTTPPGTGTIDVAMQNGQSVAVTDFVHNGETIADASNPGSYILQGSQGYCLADGSCPAAGTSKDFTITFESKAQVFNVVLLTEPIGRARLLAEQFLLNRLGVSQEQLCSLKYFVGTPYWVNATYDDRNLSFSFCPGATPLPQ